MNNKCKKKLCKWLKPKTYRFNYCSRIHLLFVCKRNCTSVLILLHSYYFEHISAVKCMAPFMIFLMCIFRIQCSVSKISTDRAGSEKYHYSCLGTGAVCCIVKALQMCRLHGTRWMLGSRDSTSAVCATGKWKWLALRLQMNIGALRLCWIRKHTQSGRKG